MLGIKFFGMRLPLYRLRKCSQPCDTQAPASKRLCTLRIVSTPLNPKWDSSVLRPVVNSDQLCLHIFSKSLSDILAVFNAAR